MALCCRFCKLCTVIVVIAAVALWVKYNYLTALPPLPDTSTAWWGRGERPGTEDKSAYSFNVTFSSKIISDLYERLDKTKLVDSLPDVQFRYGVNSDTLKTVLRHWRDYYDMDEAQSELNRYSHFLTSINGLGIHFVHVRPKSSYNNVRPLLLVHGWPGSFYEFYKMIPMLTDPAAYGGKKDDLAFEVICPSIPGFGFSDPPQKDGDNFNPFLYSCLHLILLI